MRVKGQTAFQRAGMRLFGGIRGIFAGSLLELPPTDQMRIVVQGCRFGSLLTGDIHQQPQRGDAATQGPRDVPEPLSY